MIPFNVTDHAVERFRERVCPEMSYQEALWMLQDGLLGAVRLKQRAVREGELWHARNLRCVAVCAPDRYGKAERIVRTILTEEMARIDSSGTAAPADEAIEAELDLQVEQHAAALDKARQDSQVIPPNEVRHLVPLSRKEALPVLNRLHSVALVDLARVREVEKTRRTRLSEATSDAKTLLRRVLCAALLDPTSPVGARVLGLARAEKQFEGFLGPEFLRADPAYAEVEQQPVRPPAPQSGAQVAPIAEAVRARLGVLAEQAEHYDRLQVSFPSGFVEVVYTYTALLEQVERLGRGEAVQAERLR